MTDTADNQDRRRFHRILFDASASLVDNGETIPVRLLDLSLKGALIKLEQDRTWESGHALELHVPLDGDEQHIHMQGEVVHLGNGHLGLECRFIDVDSITHLRRLVELNLAQPELLERDLKSLG